jgi:hypothetical protein
VGNQKTTVEVLVYGADTEGGMNLLYVVLDSGMRAARTALGMLGLIDIPHAIKVSMSRSRDSLQRRRKKARNNSRVCCSHHGVGNLTGCRRHRVEDPCCTVRVYSVDCAVVDEASRRAQRAFIK